MSVLLTPAKAQTKLTIMVFQGVQNLPLFAAQTQGFFAKRGLEVDIKIAPTSDEMRNGLAEGRYQIVHGAIDNAVAMAEVAKADIAVVCGGDNGWNRAYRAARYRLGRGPARQDRDRRCAEHRVRAAALRHAGADGLKKGDYEVKVVGATFRRAEAIRDDKTIAASMLNPPFSVRGAEGRAEEPRLRREDRSARIRRPAAS